MFWLDHEIYQDKSGKHFYKNTSLNYNTVSFAASSNI